MKKKYRYKKRAIFYKKLNLKRNRILLKHSFYKSLFKNLIKNLNKYNNFFIVSTLSKYNFYFFLNLKKNRNALKQFFKKNFIFFDFLKKKLNNLHAVYNNHTPVYSSSKSVIKKFRKIYKSHLGKKFIRALYYYVIPFLENFLDKKVLIKSINVNIFKKPKYKKIFLFKKLLKILKKNKSLVLSRSVNFNLPELLQIILYSFFKKDLYLLMN
jgi:hypothetical protein